MSNIQILDKTITQADGTALVAHVVRMGDQDYMTVADAAEAFGVTAVTIRRHIQEYGMSVQKADEHVLDTLRQMGAIPLRTPTVNLLPADTVEALIKIINAPEAWAAYRSIFGVGKAALQAAVTGDHGTFESKMAAALKSMSAGTIEGLQALSQKIDAVATDFTTKMKDQPFTAAQLVEIETLITETARREKLAMPRGRGYVMAALKVWHFGHRGYAARKWNQIPQGRFDELKDFLATWKAPVYAPRDGQVKRKWAKKRVIIKD